MIIATYDSRKSRIELSCDCVIEFKTLDIFFATIKTLWIVRTQFLAAPLQTPRARDGIGIFHARDSGLT